MGIVQLGQKYLETFWFSKSTGNCGYYASLGHLCKLEGNWTDFL